MDSSAIAMKPNVATEAGAVTVVVPAFNEADALRSTMPELMEFCDRRKWPLIVINDGSTDNTADVLSAHESTVGITILHHKVNRGYGAAIKTGFAHASTEFVITVDADGQHNLGDIDALYEACRLADADMVVGGRGRQSSGLYRDFGKWIIRRIVGILLPVRIHDINSGMKLYRTELAQQYVPVCPNTMAFSDIITLIFINERHLVIEHPITVGARLGGRSTISTRTGFETVLEILNIITLFNPMRIFLPFALLSAVTGLLWGIPIALRGNGVSVGAMLGISTGLLCFLIGLVAEQLSHIRKGRIR